jgi:hypothetical protein
MGRRCPGRLGRRFHAGREPSGTAPQRSLANWEQKKARARGDRAGLKARALWEDCPLLLSKVVTTKPQFDINVDKLMPKYGGSQR